MNNKFLLLASLASILIGCDKPGPVVAMDDGWADDYAKIACADANKWNQENAKLVAQLGCEAVTACRQMMPRVEACTVDPFHELNDFETELETQFGVNPQCKSVQFVRFNGPFNKGMNASDVIKGEHWALSLSYDPGARKQPWTMSHENTLLSGEGDAKEIATSICSMVTERGAKLLN